MTLPHEGALLEARDVATATNALRARGLRVSSARRLVLETLFAAGRPVRADDIAGGLGGRFPASDLASVYRNLETLEAVGLVRHVHLGHGPGLYALAGREDLEYLACERCGAHLAVPAAALASVHRAIEESTAWQARFMHFPIVGLCPSCK